MKSLTSKWVLISGASSGIGEACARAFAELGCNLVLLARRSERLDIVKKSILQGNPVEIHSFCIDVRNKNQVIELSNTLSELQITPYVLINNAGLAVGKSKIQEGLFDDWERMIDTNIKGLLYVTRAILPQMIEKNEGLIINIGSTAGHIVYQSGNVYNATKFAVRALNEGINLDLVDTDIKCCSIDPGAVETEFSKVRFKGNHDLADSVYKGYEPLQANDIAEIAVFVATRPLHVNIQNIVVYPTTQRNAFVHRKS